MAVHSTLDQEHRELWPVSPSCHQRGALHAGCARSLLDLRVFPVGGRALGTSAEDGAVKGPAFTVCVIYFLGEGRQVR